MVGRGLFLTSGVPLYRLFLMSEVTLTQVYPGVNMHEAALATLQDD